METPTTVSSAGKIKSAQYALCPEVIEKNRIEVTLLIQIGKLQH